MNRKIDMVISILSVLNSGCAFIPLNPSLPSSRIEYLVQNSNIKKVITHEELEAKLSGLDIEIFTLASLSDETKNNDPISIQPTHLAYLMYTSGSTGVPKGVLIEHKSLENIFSSVKDAVGLTKHDTFLALTDFTFDISLLELILPLTVGATVVIAEEGTICNGERIKFYINTYKPTIIQATPLTWDILLKSGWKNDGNIKIISGGEALTLKLAQKLSPEHNNVWNMYGPTETTIWSTVAVLNSTKCKFYVPIGYPVKNTKTYILNEDLDELPCGEVGELYIGGDGLARGYHNNELLTNEKFIIHPLFKERLYKTGDLAKKGPDMGLIYIGRVDDQIKVGGIRLEPKEIENCVESLDFIKKAVLIKNTEPEYSKQLILYIETNANTYLDNTECDLSLVKSWKSAYNTVYREFPISKENIDSAPGWVSAFKGIPLSQKELDESTQFILSTVQELNPQNILEVGCGVGNVTLKLIDFTRKYTAIDCSEEAIKILSSAVNEEQRNKLTLDIGYANTICDSSAHDCIIMHSVAQYFPSSDYFIDVVSNLIQASLSNGTIIISDVRSPALLDIFLLEKISHDHDLQNNISLERLYFKNRDNELLVDPYYFYTLVGSNDSVSHVDISIRNGSFENELNQYRYDVLIHVKKPVEYRKPHEIHWSDLLKDESLIDSLNKHCKDTICILGIPNVPVANKINRLCKTLPSYTSELMLPNIDVTDHEEQLFNKLININVPNCDVFTRYAKAEDYLELEVLINQKKTNCLIRADKKILNNSKIQKYFREPFNLWAQHIVYKKVAAKLNNEIPKCVHPSSVIWIEKWPTMINGKINKKKLSMLNTSYASFISNRTAAAVYCIWFEITGKNISIKDNLFYSDMSSLYAHYFLASISEKFLINISFQELMMNPSIRELANFIEDRASTMNSSGSSLEGIQEAYLL